AAEVVRAVVARAPELRGVGLELHRAIEMCADGAERANLALGGADDDPRPAAEFEDRRGVGFQRGGGTRGRRLRRRFAARGRNQELRDRIRDRDGRRDEAGGEQRIQKRAPVESRVAHFSASAWAAAVGLSEEMNATSAST